MFIVQPDVQVNIEKQLIKYIVKGKNNDFIQELLLRMLRYKIYITDCNLYQNSLSNALFELCAINNESANFII